MPESHVDTTLAFHTSASGPAVLVKVRDAVESMCRAGRTLPKLVGGAAAAGQHGPIVSISLTWRTPDPSAVLGDVLAAINDSDFPYELIKTRCSAAVIDEAEE
jgi:hypothetical protein